MQMSQEVLFFVKMLIISNVLLFGVAIYFLNKLSSIKETTQSSGTKFSIAEILLTMFSFLASFVEILWIAYSFLATPDQNQIYEEQAKKATSSKQEDVAIIDTVNEVDTTKEVSKSSDSADEIPLPYQLCFYIYIIKEGDSLNQIAIRYRTSTETLLFYNRGIRNKNLIYPGELLLIPSEF